MYIPRLLAGRLHRLMASFPAVVVSGARQVGKSTLVANELPGIDTVVFDPVIDVENARRDPDLFLANHRTPLVLDEIQFAPELVPALKRRIDRARTPGQYVVTGSQQWGVLRTISESLAGRAVFLDLAGFCLAEIARDGSRRSWLETWLDDPGLLLSGPLRRLRLGTTLYEQIWRGFLPEAQTLEPDLVPDFHAAYLRTYVERDARMLGEVSDWQLFGRFFGLACALTAQEINLSRIGRDLGLSPHTARKWLAVLIATFQWFDIPPYSGGAAKRVSGRTKGHIADTGMACAAQAISSPRAVGSHPLMGPLFETAVVAEIRKLASVLATRPALYHWRSHGGAEVDLLLERDGTFFPVEIKSTSSPTPRDASGIVAFRRTYRNLRIARGLVIAPTERITRLNETDWAVPWDIAGI